MARPRRQRWRWRWWQWCGVVVARWTMVPRTERLPHDVGLAGLGTALALALAFALALALALTLALVLYAAGGWWHRERDGAQCTIPARVVLDADGRAAAVVRLGRVGAFAVWGTRVALVYTVVAIPLPLM